MWLWRRLLGCLQTRRQGSEMHWWQSGSPVYCSTPPVGWFECGRPPDGFSRPSHYHLIGGSRVPQWSENKKRAMKGWDSARSPNSRPDADLRCCLIPKSITGKDRQSRPPSIENYEDLHYSQRAGPRSRPPGPEKLGSLKQQLWEQGWGRRWAMSFSHSWCSGCSASRTNTSRVRNKKDRGPWDQENTSK